MFPDLLVNVIESDAMLASSASTYALIDCCEAIAVALFDAMLSSSTNTPEVKSAMSMFEIEFPVPLASNVLLVNVVVELAVTSPAADASSPMVPVL